MDGRARQLVQELEQARDELAALAGTAAVRSGAAVEALRGGPVRAPVGVRRWPWAVVAAVAGAAAGAGTALLLQRVLGTDAPDAQEPEDLEAVVDRPVPDQPAPDRP